jgi:hypothetical protein
VLAVGTVITAVALVADTAHQPREVFRRGTAPPVQREVKLTAATRREIDRTLAEFVPAAVGRRDPAHAWRLAGPGLRAGGNLREWKRGVMPVQPYAFSNKSLRGWRLVYAHEDRVAIDLTLFPRAGSREGMITFGIDLVPGKSGWLVDSIFPARVWSGKPPPTRATSTPSERPASSALNSERHSALWLLVPGLILGAAIVVPLAIFARGLMSRRRRPAERMPAVPKSFSRRP